MISDLPNWKDEPVMESDYEKYIGEETMKAWLDYLGEISDNNDLVESEF